MCKIIVPFPDDENINFYLENEADGFIIGIEEYSENFNRYIKLEELKEKCNLILNKNKKVYIGLNKIYFNSELPNLKKILLILDDINISGVLFTDIAVLNIINENNLKMKPVWYGNHLATNSYTINFLEKRGLKGVILSDEITIDEKLQIASKVNIPVAIKLFGYTNMATSSRSLLTNYFKYTNIKQNSTKKYYMKEKNSGEYYPIIERENTNFFSSKILNGIKEFPKIIESNNVDWIFLDDYMINKNSFYNVIEAFKALKIASKDTEFVNKLYEVVNYNNYGNTSDGFLNKKTIFKVKNNE